MPETVIIRCPKPDAKELSELREIYFETSARKDFASEEEKEQFFWKYLGFYLHHFSEYVWIAKGDRVLGYVVGMPRTEDEQLCQIQPHLLVFKKYFSDYPAHLHINLHSEARGLGLGSKLVKALEIQLQEAGITGLHIMTSPSARNKIFYQRLGFNFEVVLDFRDSPILLMGKRLSGE